MVVAVFVGLPGISIELRGPGGQLLLSAGPGTRTGPALPNLFAPVPARTGVLRTVRGVGGSYLVIAEPVHFTAQRLVFGYGADDFAITGGSGAGKTGQTGTLVVGRRLASIVQPVRRLTLLAVAVSAAAIVIVGGLGWAAIRFSLRPVSRAAQTADAAAAAMAGDSRGLVRPVPERPADDLAGDLAEPAGGLADGLAGVGRRPGRVADHLGRRARSPVHRERARGGRRPRGHRAAGRAPGVGSRGAAPPHQPAARPGRALGPPGR